MEIFARRDQLPPPEEDEFYYEDLVGLEAVDAAGAPLGRVVSLTNHGAGDILEIALVGGGETLLLPFTKGVAPRIDFDAGRIVIEPPREVEDETSFMGARGRLLRTKGADRQRALAPLSSSGADSWGSQTRLFVWRRAA